MHAGMLFFTTSTCPNCRPVKPIIEHLKSELEDSDFEISTVVVDKSPDGIQLAKTWEVRAVPTIVFYRGVVEQSRIVGSTTSREIEDHVERCLQRDVFQESSRGSDEGSCSLLCDSSEQGDLAA